MNNTEDALHRNGSSGLPFSNIPSTYLLFLIKEQQITMSIITSQLQKLQNRAETSQADPPQPQTHSEPHTAPLPDIARSRASTTTLLQILNSSKFSTYHGHDIERTLVKVRSFISGVQKVTNLYPSISGVQEVHIVSYFLRDTPDY